MGIAYAYVVGSRDWKMTEVQWSKFEFVGTLLKRRVRVGFGVVLHILCVDSC